MSGTDYLEFKSDLNYQEFYFEIENEIKLHSVLFKPDSIAPKRTIFHYYGKGMHLMSSIEQSYKPLLKKGFYVFCFERRHFGKSHDLTMLLKSQSLYETIFR
jgi:hypothetical protein